MAKFSKAKPLSEVNQILSKKKAVVNAEHHSCFNVSFQYLDTSQFYASTFSDWQKIGLLSTALEMLRGYCARPLVEQVDGDKFTIYGDFPNDKATLFTYPQHVPLDAQWARIHVNGPAVIVGHVLGDTFYVVFLDKTHKFWLTSRERVKRFGKQYA